MAITAAQVKELREMTGAGMMECKKALIEADGDMNKAVDVLRTRGLAAAVKKAGRATNEGTCSTFVSEDRKVAAVVEVNCETDFVGGNEKYKAFAARIAKAAALADAADVEGLKAADAGNGETVGEALTEAIHIFGENMQISRFARIAVAGTGAVASYIHLGGKMGVLVEFAFNKPETAFTEAFQVAGKDVCMQVAAADPVAVSREAVPADVVEHEMEIYKAKAAATGKPAAIQERIALGQMQKYYKSFCLLEQVFVKDPDTPVADYLKGVSKAVDDQISVVSFKRFKLGEAL